MITRKSLLRELHQTINHINCKLIAIRPLAIRTSHPGLTFSETIAICVEYSSSSQTGAIINFTIFLQPFLTLHLGIFDHTAKMSPSRVTSTGAIPTDWFIGIFRFQETYPTRLTRRLGRWLASCSNLRPIQLPICRQPSACLTT